MPKSKLTAADHAALIGRTGTVTFGPLAWPCQVNDSRVMYGRHELLITPVLGSGEQWVTRKMVDDLTKRTPMQVIESVIGGRS